MGRSPRDATVTPLPVAYEGADDAQIMDGVRVGDGRAVAALYDRYNALIFSLALRMLGSREGAEELVQEVFLRAWRQAASYQPSLGKLSTWLLGIARNLAVDELRRRGARPQRADGESEEQLASIATPAGDDPAAQAAQAAQRTEIRAALDALPPAQRRVIEMAYYGGLTQSEIAAELGEPLGTVKTRMRLGTQKLRDLLREMNQVSG